MADTKKYLDLTGLATLVNGIKDGTLISGRATADADGNAITTTYATKAEIAALDAVEEVGDDGHGHQQIITGIEQKDGKLFALSAATLDGTDITYTKGTEETGPLSAATTVDQALKTLAAKASAQELVAADKSIVVDTPSTGTNTGKTTVNVNIKSGEKVIKLDNTANGGIYTDIKLTGVTVNDANVKEAWALVSGNEQLGDTIKIYKDSALLDIKLLHASGSTKPTYSDGTWTDIENPTEAELALCYAYENKQGTVVVEAVPVGDFLRESEFKNGLQVASNGEVSVKVDTESEKVITAYGETNTEANVLSVSSDGVKVSNIQAAINAKIGTLDVTDTAVDGKYVSQVSETDGKISVSRADVSGAVLNNYSKGSSGTAVAATDTLNQAISKLENQVDKAKAAATTEVVEGTDNDHIAVTSGTSQTDGHTIYTITATDVASESALTAEIAARKAVDGQNGQTYAANSSANYISGATSLNNADVLLDTALKTEADRAKSAETAIDGAIGLTKGQNDETRTWTPTTNYKVSSGTHTVANNMQAIDTQVKKNTDAIALLNNTSAVTGSVKEQVATAKNAIIGTSNDASSVLTLNGLKKKIEEAASAATTVVENAVSGQDYVNVTKDTTAADGHTVYKVGVSDIASAEAVGLNSDGSYKAFTNTNYIDDSAITSIAEAVEALDTAIGAVGDSSASTTVYGKIAETWQKTLGVERQIPDYEHDAIPTLWGLKEELDKVAEEAEAEHTQVAEKSEGHVLVDVTPTTVSGKTYDLVTITEDNIASADLVGELPTDASTTYSASTVVQYAKNYTDVQIDALDKSFVAITDSEITALFNNYPLNNSGSGE